MAKKDKVYMPAGTGGLMRYGEEGEEAIRLKPEHVVAVVVVIVVLELFMKFFFG